MKLVLICDAQLENGALSCAAWIKGMISELCASHEITVFSFYDSQTAEIRRFHTTNAVVRVVSGAFYAEPARFTALMKKAPPDVIIVFGTEKSYTLPAVDLCEKAGMLNRTVLFAQGMACACAAHYAEGVPDHIVRRWTFRDIFRRSNIREEQKKMQKFAEAEKAAIQTVRHYIGRSTLDRAVLKIYNPTASYYRCNDILRSDFYEGQWLYDSCEPQRIFVSQYYYPLKGFHYLLRAVALLKEKYPRLKIIAAGYNPILTSAAKRELKDSSYIRYIKTLIRRYDLLDRVEFTGSLSEKQMKAEYLKANVFVLPSTIENSPNSLAEAMMLGVPCIASDVGGVSDFAVHREEAYLYPSSSTELLAYYLDLVLSDSERAANLGAKGRERAQALYDRTDNTSALENAFHSISGKS